jgi:hypothetical protein
MSAVGVGKNFPITSGSRGQTAGAHAPQDVPVTAGAWRRSVPSVVVLALFAVVIAELVAVGVGWLVTQMSTAAAVDSFMVPNATIGACCGVSGVLIGAYRHENRLGWLLLGAGVCQAGTAAVTPWLVQALHGGGAEVSEASDVTARMLATVYSAAWPWSIALFIPLALLAFPDGRWPGRGRWLVPIVFVNGVVQVLVFSADPDPLATVQELDPVTRPVQSYLAIDVLARGNAVETVSQVVLSATFLCALLALLMRFRRGTEQVRRQLLWLLLATAAAVVLVGVSRLGGAAGRDRVPRGSSDGDSAGSGGDDYCGVAPRPARHPSGVVARAHLRGADRRGGGRLPGVRTGG